MTESMLHLLSKSFLQYLFSPIITYGCEFCSFCKASSLENCDGVLLLFMIRNPQNRLHVLLQNKVINKATACCETLRLVHNELINSKES